MNDDEFNWLIADEGAQFLQLVEKQLRDDTPIHQVLNRLRKTLGPEQASLICLQAQLRQKAMAKFSQADKMFFLRKQLEQSTSEAIARYKATRFRNPSRIVDICCGIGGDAIGLCADHQLTLSDLDNVCCRIAAANVKCYGGKPELLVGSAVDVPVEDFDAFHIDPDRRPNAKNREGRADSSARATAAELFSPSMEIVSQLCERNPNYAIKLSPLTRLPVASNECEWIGHERECKQQVVWSGQLAAEPGSRATVIGDDGKILSTYFRPNDHLQMERPAPAPVDRFLFAPHPALVAAGLSWQFAEEHQLALIDSRVQYLTGDRAIKNALLACFQILAVSKLKDRMLSQLFSKEDIGHLEVKRQGVDESLGKRIQSIPLTGTKRCTVILTPTLDGIRAILAKRLPPRPAQGEFAMESRR